MFSASINACGPSPANNNDGSGNTTITDAGDIDSGTVCGEDEYGANCGFKLDEQCIDHADIGPNKAGELTFTIDGVEHRIIMNEGAVDEKSIACVNPKTVSNVEITNPSNGNTVYMNLLEAFSVQVFNKQALEGTILSLNSLTNSDGILGHFTGEIQDESNIVASSYLLSNNGETQYISRTNFTPEGSNTVIDANGENSLDIANVDTAPKLVASVENIERTENSLSVELDLSRTVNEGVEGNLNGIQFSAFDKNGNPLAINKSSGLYTIRIENLEDLNYDDELGTYYFILKATDGSGTVEKVVDLTVPELPQDDAGVDAGFVDDAGAEDSNVETDANNNEDAGIETDANQEDADVDDAGAEDSSVETDANNNEDAGMPDEDAGIETDANQEDADVGDAGIEDSSVETDAGGTGAENHAPTINTKDENNESTIPNETFSLDPYEFSFQLNDTDGDDLEWEVVIENIGRFFKPFSVTQGSGTYEYNTETNIVTIRGNASSGDVIRIRTENIGDNPEGGCIYIEVLIRDGKGGFKKIRIPILVL